MNRVLPETIALIKAWEGFFPRPYNDTGGVLAIGYGHATIGPPIVTADMVWDEQKATEVLLADLKLIGDQLAPNLKVRVNDYQWGALLSLAYNKGVGRLLRSEVWEALHDPTDKYAKVTAGIKILEYAVHAEDKVTKQVRVFLGLKARRCAEAGYFLKRHSSTETPSR